MKGVRAWTAVAAMLFCESAVADFDKAIQAYERGQYRDAQRNFLMAAADGDPRAQEVVGVMYALGPQVYPGVQQDLGNAFLAVPRGA